MNIAFDVTLAAVVRVDVPEGISRADAIEAAKEAVLSHVDCIDLGYSGQFTTSAGHLVTVTLTEASHADEALEAPFEIDGEDPEASSTPQR